MTIEEILRPTIYLMNNSTLFRALCAAIIGMIVGSFTNVVIYRSLKKINGEKADICLARSACPQCKRKILWYQNIPVLSFLALKGKCHYCSFKIPVSYFLIEFLTAVVYCWIAAIYDIRYMMILGVSFTALLSILLVAYKKGKV